MESFCANGRSPLECVYYSCAKLPNRSLVVKLKEDFWLGCVLDGGRFGFPMTNFEDRKAVDASRVIPISNLYCYVVAAKEGEINPMHVGAAFDSSGKDKLLEIV